MCHSFGKFLFSSYGYFQAKPYYRENKVFDRQQPSPGLRNGKSSSLKCLGMTLCGIDTLVYTLHENRKMKTFGTHPKYVVVRP